jgi:hypothetical protein
MATAQRAFLWRHVTFLVEGDELPSGGIVGGSRDILD